jgi:hypothetical protein
MEASVFLGDQGRYRAGSMMFDPAPRLLPAEI